MTEAAFELALCAHLEAETDRLVARQLGGGVAQPGSRVLDVVTIEPGPDFEARASITPRSIPSAAIDAPVGTGRFRPWRKAVDRSPEYARRVVDRAVEIGFFERDRRGGREYVRQVARYPERWFGSITAIENKPDLGSPGRLETQLRIDVSLGLLDEVILATESYVTRAHLNRLPEEIGVWRFDPEAVLDPSTAESAIEIIREPTPLDPESPGVELLERKPGRTDVAIVSTADKRRARRQIAERAYGKGWRTYDLPGCEAAKNGAVAGVGGLPYCAWKGRIVDPQRCGTECPGYDPADPPTVDHERERDSTSPWVADPEGKIRRQSGLDRFW